MVMMGSMKWKQIRNNNESNPSTWLDLDWSQSTEMMVIKLSRMIKNRVISINSCGKSLSFNVCKNMQLQPAKYFITGFYDFTEECYLTTLINWKKV
jgi:hypothetical protein